MSFKCRCSYDEKTKDHYVVSELCCDCDGLCVEIPRSALEVAARDLVDKARYTLIGHSDVYVIEYEQIKALRDALNEC